ncbi:MAG: pyridoxal-phosphate dependent enzyme [Flavobacteriales bacterium]|nr:pyridoxal-phosphate dependent enzyme [Flavobacteriales bacterium]
MGWIESLINKTKVETFVYSKLNDLNCKLFIKRDDLIHEEISGNKIRKLKYNLKYCFDSNLAGIVTYGGAYSNHLLASAAAANLAGIRIIGRVRGNELKADSNAVLKRCSELGMHLEFLERNYFSKIKNQNGIVEIDGKSFLSIPEGGSNLNGVEGCKEIITELEEEFDYYCLAQGTTTTSIGIAQSIPKKSKLIVVPVLKGFDSEKEMSAIIGEQEFQKIKNQLIVLNDYHFGGYSKSTELLRHFVKDFNQQNTFDIESVYTGKAMFALVDFLKSKNIRNKKVLFVHTGGLSNWMNS